MCSLVIVSSTKMKNIYGYLHLYNSVEKFTLSKWNNIILPSTYVDLPPMADKCCHIERTPYKMRIRYHLDIFQVINSIHNYVLRKSTNSII